MIGFSSDGGATWTTSTLPRSIPYPMIDALTCPTTTTCYAAGGDLIAQQIGNTYNAESSVVAVTHDAGRTWQRVTFAVPAKVPGGMQGDSFMDIGQIQCPRADACVAIGDLRPGIDIHSDLHQPRLVHDSRRVPPSQAMTENLVGNGIRRYGGWSQRRMTARGGSRPDRARPAAATAALAAGLAGSRSGCTLPPPPPPSPNTPGASAFLHGTGPVDPDLARDLAAAAARNPRSTWCVTVTDQDGHAAGHGCARPAAQRKPDGPDPLGGPSFTLTPAGQPGPPGGYVWRFTTGQQDMLIKIGPLPTGDCDHWWEARGHDPGVMLLHLTEVRHARCTGPGCRRPAARCDFEHNVPYESGGRTCLCNGGPECRSDHRMKQDPRWNAEQLPGGYMRWTTPPGRQYTTEPTRYPPSSCRGLSEARVGVTAGRRRRVRGSLLWSGPG